MDVILSAFSLIGDPQVLLVVILSAAFGMFVGAMPGLTATMAVALLVPITFFMAPVPALAAIVTASSMAIFAGDIPAAMLRMPGTPASAAYTDESYAMGRKGLLNLTLGTNLLVSVIGGLIGVAALIFAAPALAEVALRFTAFEYFWLTALGLSCAIFIASSDPLKAMLSLLIGLSLATVGIDPTAGVQRFTFGNVELMGGINFIPAMIGLFAISEIMRGAMRMQNTTPDMPPQSGPVFKGVGKVIWTYKKNVARGSILGTMIGALPGAGADIAAWISYAVSKRFSKEKEKYGTGHIEGVVDATAANNSSVGAAWIPALVFGIPGDSITAIVIGVLYMKGMNPGPTVFLENPQFIYAVFMIFIVANLVMIPMGWAVIKGARPILRVPRQVLLPIILIFCIVGSFAMTNSIYGVVLMLGFGVAGWLLEENGYPVAPIILGLVLGGMFERTFMSSMLRTGGDLLGFFERPIAATLGVITLLLWAFTIFRALQARGRPSAPILPGGAG
ncbi:C4-dicarboxylate ABC transporter permease [Arsenicitalea aurantiaca]|uniref:C4-dicarboxylate ABC transporter permease n=1 Tax=Arsenicitalea aurantiaca TaxID=1783274 RepID=A0A433X5D7_9HYPH|nr:tripartite tricarboxylate transporter permease [Arsenicitalea aurantiaca]RUT29296.1 C4-dicarboxylate ABC transporter permease [Arsenicitalea aurantiaca]